MASLMVKKLMSTDIEAIQDTVTLIKSGETILSVILKNQKTHKVEMYHCIPVSIEEFSEVVTQKLQVNIKKE